MAEAYPDAYLRQALPLVFIAGLTSCTEKEEVVEPSQGCRVFTEDGDDQVSWSARDVLSGTFVRESCPNPGIWVQEMVGNKSRNPSPVIKMKLVSRRDMVLPITKRTNECKYTPLSPLNPKSPLYPDGCMTHEWVEKYTDRLPAAVISLYDECNLESQDRLDKVCTEIDEVKRKLNLYGIRLVIVILGDKQNERLPELFATIRKRCSIDTKSGLLHLGSTDPLEIDRFVLSLKSTILSPVLDFYQSQIKKIKRKKGRHSPVPVETEDDHKSERIQIPLLSSGWHARYDYKMAVFNELKLDMESAVRQYETAYESMVEGFEPIPPFTQRWNEQRLLLDVIAFKVLKLYLYLEMPTLAQRKLNVHLITVQALVSNVIFSATATRKNNTHVPLFSSVVWKSIQFELVAQLLHVVPESISPRNVPFISTQPSPNSLPPGDMLHHAGFFMWRAAETYQERMRLKQLHFDQDECTYLLWTESKIDYTAKIVSLYDAAMDEFESTSNYPRFVANLLLKKSICLENAGNYHQALTELKRVAFSYRGDSWNNLLKVVLEKCLECAQKTDSQIELASIVYELDSLNFQFTNQGLEVLESNNEWIQLEFPPDSLTTCLSGNFMFDTPRITVGQTVGCQLTILNSSSVFKLSEIEVAFDDESGGNVTKVIIKDNGGAPSKNKTLTCVTELKSVDKTTFTANAPLSASDSVVQFRMPIHHHLGLWTTRYIIATVECGKIKTRVRQGLRVRYNIDDYPPIWWSGNASRLVPGIVVNGKQPWQLNIVAKTSKVDIQFDPRPQQPVYCEELVHIPVKVINNEEFQIKNGKIILKLEQIGGTKRTHVQGGWGRETVLNESSATEDDKGKEVEIPDLNSGESSIKDVFILAPSIASEVVVHMDMEYVLSNDLETDISKSQSITLSVVKPFDSRYTFSPQVLPDEWSSFFFVDDTAPRQTPMIKRRWRIDTQLLSQASIDIVDYSLEFIKTVGVECKTIEPQHPRATVVLENEQEGTVSFEFDATNNDLLDKRVGYVEAVVSISWQRRQTPGQDSERSSSREIYTTNPKLAPLKLSLPLSEPRLLVSFNRKEGQDGICDLMYYLENPTGMMLTFSLTMESSVDLFAYGGCKHASRVRVLPFSRHVESYQLLVMDGPQDSTKLRLPTLRVFDVYFRRALAPIPACANLKLEKSGDIFYLN